MTTRWNALAEPNTVLDTAYYNVAGLPAESRDAVLEAGPEEGDVVVLWPRSANQPVSIFPTVSALLEKQGGLPDIAHVAVAGVGSSALGAAALAQDVADVVSAPVAGIVAGHGVRDFVKEGLEGAASLGAADTSVAVRDRTGEAVASVAPDAAQMTLAAPRPHFPWIVEARVLAELLQRRKGRIALLVGHSRGAVIISDALALRPTSKLATEAFATALKSASADQSPLPPMAALEGSGLADLVARAYADMANPMAQARMAEAGQDAVRAATDMMERALAAARDGRSIKTPEGLRDTQATGATIEPRIVTFGRPSAIPRERKLVWQFLGTHDGLGWANWTMGVPTLLAPFRTHTLNPLFPTHMPLKRLLEKAMSDPVPPENTRLMPAF